MDALDEKLKTIQTWMDNLQQQIKTSTAFNTTDVLLNQIISLIQLQKTPTSSEQAVAATYADLDKQVKAQTAALNQATNTLKSQIDKREAEALKLRQAYNDLEVHLREHIAYQTKLNQNLQAQIEEQKRTLTLEEEERALTKALRDTLTTMSSTLDLDKILDHILDTVSRITPYDGANILLIESDLVRVARQKGYQERGLQEDWVKQRIPLTKLAILQQLMDAEKPLAVSDTTNSPMWLGFPDMDWVSSNVIAPIRANGRTLGFLSLDSATPGYFTQADADRLQGFAEQAAIAIQNARLLDRAKRAAVLAERNRLGAFQIIGNA